MLSRAKQTSQYKFVHNSDCANVVVLGNNDDHDDDGGKHVVYCEEECLSRRAEEVMLLKASRDRPRKND